MADVKMETCLRCKERWFDMRLKDDICRRCYLRDTDPGTRGCKQVLSPFLMSVNNEMDPGDIPAHLPALTQVEEMVIARAHVQMLLKRGHQYQYTGHCVSFMQNIIKTVDVLPLLPSELDIVLLKPSESVTGRNSRYQRQFQADFRVRRGYVLTWLRFLKAHHPDYRYITVSPERIEALPVDDDVSPLVTTLVEDIIASDEPPIQEESDMDSVAPPTSQSVVPNLTRDTTEVELILESITGRKALPTGVPAPSIRQTPLDEISGRERILAMAFPALYPTGQADFNTPRLRTVSIKDYAQHMLCWHDGRFGRHPRWVRVRGQLLSYLWL